MGWKICIKLILLIWNIVSKYGFFWVKWMNYKYLLNQFFWNYFLQYDVYMGMEKKFVNGYNYLNRFIIMLVG